MKNISKLNKLCKKHKTFEKFILAEYDAEKLKDMSNNGLEGGFNYLVYYGETQTIYENYYNEIWQMLKKGADTARSKNVLEFMTSLNGAQNIVDDAPFKNFLVWYAAESIATKYCEKVEQEEQQRQEQEYNN